MLEKNQKLTLSKQIRFFFQSLFLNKKTFTKINSLSDVKIYHAAILYLFTIITSIAFVVIFSTFIHFLTHKHLFPSILTTYALYILLDGSLPYAIIFIQILILLFILIQVTITYLCSRFLVKIKIKLGKYIVNSAYAASILLWFWLSQILYLFFAQTYDKYLGTVFSLLLIFGLFINAVNATAITLNQKFLKAVPLCLWILIFIPLFF